MERELNMKLAAPQAQTLRDSPVRAQPLKLKKSDTIECAFRRIAENCLAQVQGNEHSVASGHDPSSLHQMRVGLRRLRSALGLFEDALSAPASLQAELRWIAGELGAARDWDVMIDSTLPTAFDGAPADTRAQVLTQAAIDIGKRNRARAAAAIGSARYTTLIIELTRWLNECAWREPMNGDQLARLDQKIPEFACETLRKRHRKLIKRGRHLPELDAKRRHRARIAAKKLRYATEFFSSLYSKQVVRHYVAALSELQDDLGWRNDVAVGDALLKMLAADHPQAAVAAGYARGYLASRVAADHDTLKKVWKRFRRFSPPH